MRCYFSKKLYSVHLGFHTFSPSDITKYLNVLNSFFPSYTNSIIPSMRCCRVFWHESLFTNWLPIALDSITFHVIIDSFLLVFAPLCYKEIKISSKRHSFSVFSICPIFQNCHCLHNSHLLCCLSLFCICRHSDCRNQWTTHKLEATPLIQGRKLWGHCFAVFCVFISVYCFLSALRRRGI